ncbi:MAG: hypothetical protein DMG93_09120 [Acidobacteria bacterium]|nr:MAG: hypothetical protein DMG93_09120 [Acidobacteriota bacterium]
MNKKSKRVHDFNYRLQLRISSMFQGIAREFDLKFGGCRYSSARGPGTSAVEFVRSKSFGDHEN